MIDQTYELMERQMDAENVEQMRIDLDTGNGYSPLKEMEDNPFDDVDIPERTPSLTREHPLPWSVQCDDGFQLVDADGVEILSSTSEADYHKYMVIVSKFNLVTGLLTQFQGGIGE